MVGCVFFFQAEDGIRDLVRSRGLGDVYKRQLEKTPLGRAEWVKFVALFYNREAEAEAIFAEIASASASRL